MNFLFQHKFLLLFVYVLLCTSFAIYKNFPAEEAYFYNADEGTYLNQATVVKEKGWKGFSQLSTAYLENKNQEQFFPLPSRVGHISLAALALTINPVPRALSYLSLISYILLCVAVFYFLRKWFGDLVAGITASVVCVSPLLCGTAARALMDLDAALFQTLSLFLLIQYVRTPVLKNMIFFILITTVNLLIKETAVLFVPFYLLVLLYSRYGEQHKALKLSAIFFSVFMPLILCGAVLLLTFDGLHFMLSVANIIVANNIEHATVIPYVRDFNSGPWYQYFMDYMMLSPLTMLGFLFFVGYYIQERKWDGPISIILLYAVYLLLSYSVLPRNVRYAMPLDIPIRIGACLFLFTIWKRSSKRVVATDVLMAAVVLLIGCYDLFQYNKFFVKGKIYDPVSYQLLRAEKIIPVN